MRRFGRRLDVAALRRELPLSMQLFDCLHLDGEDWLDRPAEQRWQALASRVPDELRVARVVSADPAEAGAFFDSALAAGHDGEAAAQRAGLQDRGVGHADHGYRAHLLERSEPGIAEAGQHDVSARPAEGIGG